MKTINATVAGAGVLHACLTRDGQQFRILAAHTGGYEIFVYDPAEHDRAVSTIVLEEDEADQVADLLHSRSMADRIAELERRVAAIAGSLR